MTKQSIILFIRALIVGILINIGLQQVSMAQIPADEALFTNQPLTIEAPAADLEAQQTAR